jgi:hypothetical protein
MSEIAVWILAHQSWNVFKPTEYYCITPPGREGKTISPRLATRWFTEAEASYFATLLPGRWTPKLLLVDGKRLAAV